MRPWQSWIWCWCWALGFALICAYIAFDVLDLDGSELQKRLDSGAVVTAAAQGEVERLFRLDLSPSEPWARQLPGPGCCVAADTLRIRSQAILGFAVVRHGPLLPRRLLSLAPSAKKTLPTDPDPA